MNAEVGRRLDELRDPGSPNRSQRPECGVAPALAANFSCHFLEIPLIPP
jgi:hypothetical protein